MQTHPTPPPPFSEGQGQGPTSPIAPSSHRGGGAGGGGRPRFCLRHQQPHHTFNQAKKEPRSEKTIRGRSIRY
eukprot:scaffold8624_cov110-Isochrysis_galbana.AAC.14